MVGAVGF